MKLRIRTLVAVAAAFSLLPSGVFAGDNKKKDPEEIGNRDVGKGVNFTRSENRARKAVGAGSGAPGQDH
jgi:hypothetical protein